MKKFTLLVMIWSVACLNFAAQGASPPTAAELIEKSQPTDWRTVDPADTLYMDLPAGRVVIELNADFAPLHVANVKVLAKEKYWDGLDIVRVQDNYVVQWADPQADKPALKRKVQNAKETLSPAELDVAQSKKVPFNRLSDKDTYADEVGFSNGFAAGRDPHAKRMWLLHCYGAVGVGRDVAPESGGGTELYAVIGQAPRHLDRNVTVIGHVIHGAELLSSLPRGHGPLGFYEKPEQNIPIRSLRLASDLPKDERLRLEVLRTDTQLFEKWVQARRNRSEPWFHFQAGHIDACNLSIPVRERKD